MCAIPAGLYSRLKVLCKLQCAKCCGQRNERFRKQLQLRVESFFLKLVRTRIKKAPQNCKQFGGAILDCLSHGRLVSQKMKTMIAVTSSQ
jgi:hypothetical protein